MHSTPLWLSSITLAAAGGWLAYCSRARDLLRERPLENPPVADKQNRMTWDAAEGRDCARRD